MDCNKRFEGDEYWEHTACVTEAQRYQGALYVHKENKGELKQQAWSDQVQTKLEAATKTATTELRPLIVKLQQYDNLPRKQGAFINFAKNSLNLKGAMTRHAERLWEIINAKSEGGDGSTDAKSESAPAYPVAAPAVAPAITPAVTASTASQDAAPADPSTAKVERKAAKAEATAAQDAAAEASRKRPQASDALASQEPGEAPEEKTKKKKKKTAAAEEEAAGGAGSAAADEGQMKPIKWKKIISKELQSCGGRMKLKELRKAAVAEARAHPSHQGREKEQLLREFDELLPTFNKYVVQGNHVALAPEQKD